MARQSGIIKIKGAIDGLSFYRDGGVDLVRQKSSLDGDRVKNDPSFIRTMENATEFGAAGANSKMLRDTFRGVRGLVFDRFSSSRITAKILDIARTYDTTSVRGQRRLSVAMALTPNAVKQFVGFDFNFGVSFWSVVFGQIEPGPGGLALVITPNLDIEPPIGATHFRFTSLLANIDFVTGASSIISIETTPEYVPLSQSTTEVLGIPTLLNPNDLRALSISFYQQINGVLYKLKDNSKNATTFI